MQLVCFEQHAHLFDAIALRIQRKNPGLAQLKTRSSTLPNALGREGRFRHDNQVSWLCRHQLATMTSDDKTSECVIIKSYPISRMRIDKSFSETGFGSVERLGPPFLDERRRFVSTRT